MATCSPTELVAAGKCFVGLPEPQHNAIILTLLCQILKAANPMAHCDIASLMEDAKCFVNAEPVIQRALILQLLCEILHGGGTSQTCLICLDLDVVPTDPAPCDCSIAYNRTGNAWFWDSLTTAWFQVL